MNNALKTDICKTTISPNLDMVLEWLESDDEVLISHATEVLVQLRTEFLPAMVCMALDPGRSEIFRLHMLDVIAAKGQPVPPESWIELSVAKRVTKSPELRLAIGRVLEMHRQAF